MVNENSRSIISVYRFNNLRNSKLFKIILEMIRVKFGF